MKTTIKRLSVMLLVLCAALPLAACGGTDTPEPEPGPEPARVGQIYLYGEAHADKICLAQELELWRGHYDGGMRDLFIEAPYYMAEFLNRWMQSDTDEILEEIYRDSAGTQGHSPDVLDFYRSIKADCPETVFHGTDIGHMYGTMGRRYLDLLEAEGQQDGDAYALARENAAQGEEFYTRCNGENPTAYSYRENCMAENFIRAFDALGGADAMGIYGTKHTDPESMDVSNRVPSMAQQLAERYGDALHCEDLPRKDLLPVETVTIGGKSYQARSLGGDDGSGSANYLHREFLRLEDAYEDFRDAALTGNVLPCSNYPVQVEDGQVFVIDYTRKDGTTERQYFRSDGFVWNGMTVTQEFTVDE